MAVASSIETTDVGIGRSFEEDEDDDRREDSRVLVAVRASRRTEVRDVRLGGISTGVVFIGSKGSMMERESRLGRLSVSFSICV